MIETASLVDQYCHGVHRTELGLGAFEARLCGTAAQPAPGTTFFDTQAGFAVRRWCPPLLGLEPHCAPARYLARRRELGTFEASRRLLRATGISTYLVDTGARSPDGTAGELTGSDETGRMGGASGREIVRLEPLAERVAAFSAGADTFLAGLAESVGTAAASAVAFSCAAVPRHGLALDPDPPGPGEVRGAVARWLAGPERPRDPLTDPVLLRHLLWTAVRSGLPLHLDSGTAAPGRRAGRAGRVEGPGRTDPMLLTGFAAATAGLGTDLVLRDSYPYHRQAAHLTSVFPHVYADLGSALTRTGAAAASVLAEILEITPFGKLLFSSGARGLPELHVVAVRVFREALERVLGGWVRDGSWSADDARRVAGMIAAGNARRVHGLPGD
jgi:uncharacterized protein